MSQSQTVSKQEENPYLKHFLYFVLYCNIPPIRLREGLSLKARGTSRGKARPFQKRMGGIPFSLKLEGQDWQCIFLAFQFSPPRCRKAWVFPPL